MPDLAVHVCAAVVGGKAIRDPAGRALFYLGNCLPDLAQKALNLGAASPVSFTEITHSPFGILCLAYAAAMLFEEGWRPRAFRLLLAGSFLHLLMDASKSYLGHGVILWAFPLGLTRYEFGWYPPEVSPILLLPWAVAAAVAAEILDYRFRRRA